MLIDDVPAKPSFEMGDRYLRKEIHDQFGGQRYYGISTPKSEPFILIFTDPRSEEYGYRDRFLENGLFVYSGEGQVGDMTMDGGNKQIRDHKQNGDSLYVFETVGEQDGAQIVTYNGEYEYFDHYREDAPDDNNEMRDAIRFKLAPRGGINVDLEESRVGSLSTRQLYERAHGRTNSVSTRSVSNSNTSYTRSDLIRDFALRVADGECQACHDSAPFKNKSGKPFLEVHHLFRISDGGVDAPENVVAVCPNCHREIHYGQSGEEINTRLIEESQVRNQKFQ